MLLCVSNWHLTPMWGIVRKKITFQNNLEMEVKDGTEDIEIGDLQMRIHLGLVTPHLTTFQRP